MRKKDRLKAEALASCKARGHSMGKFKRVKLGREIHRSICARCQRDVDVIPCPLPNEIEIGGQAVALDCKVTQ